MGLSIRYRSTDTMHPALAFEIKQHAEQLIAGFTWLSCEPVNLQQSTDGYLGGASKPNFFPAEADTESAHKSGVPDGTVMTLAEVLCQLSRDHEVDWEIGHDYEAEPIGRICSGVADKDLAEQLETLGSVGDLFDELFTDDEDAFADLDEIDEEDEDDCFGDDLHSKKLAQWTSAEFGAPIEPSSPDESDDDGEPRVLKFPTTE